MPRIPVWSEGDFVEKHLDIVDHSTPCGVGVGRIVSRILAYAPQEAIAHLKSLEIWDIAPERKGFARYVRGKGRIDLFVQETICWLPWILRKTFVLPYLFIGLALGHEIDHHVNRDRDMPEEEREKSAESNAMTYVYPSPGMLKPAALLMKWFMSKRGVRH